MKNPSQLMSVDFSQPWWRIIVDQKWLALPLLFSVSLRDIFWTLEPFLIALVLEYQNWYFFAFVCFLWALFVINLIITARLTARFQLQTIHSIFYSAHLHLLTIDPKYHVKRSSGAILAKIERAARGYEEVLDQITYSFAPLILGVATMIIILSQYSLLLMACICFCLLAMAFYGYYFIYYACQRWENDFIKSDDDFKAAAFENLAQVHLVRASFATDQMRNKLTEKITENCAIERDLWLSYSFVSRILDTLYAISILVLVGYFMYCIQHNITSLAHAIGIILAYIQCTHPLIKILQPLRRYMRGMAAINDLFAFMRQFGKQTIPVFGTTNFVIEKNKTITVEARDIVFSYDGAKLFDHHNLKLSANIHDHNKLYGIIGPSGVGKTTLISILGGQLKPLEGTIYINDIDIYAVGDNVRRQLIALQGQIASSIKGSVRYNLLFGLPENHAYTDEYLFVVLQRVGLAQILLEHQGLDTLLGEGALNISGGQRQRLNFASLYLRACYYKPVLILIDEPTSSLDEISERAITGMILELASSAITLVIAHRLKTLDDAVGLLDLSLLSSSKTIEAYSSEELKKHSVYYRMLLEGKSELQ